MNGAPITHGFGLNQDTNKFNKDNFWIKLIKFKVIMANLLSQGGTQNKSNEEIVKKVVSCLSIIEKCYVPPVDQD